MLFPSFLFPLSILFLCLLSFVYLSPKFNLYIEIGFWYRYQWQWVAIEEIYPITNMYRPCFIDLSGGLP